MPHRPAGGIKSRNVVHKPVKTGVGARGVNVKWPAQVGVSRGNRVQGGVEGGRGGVLPVPGKIIAEPYKGTSFRPVKQGNEIAAATKCGPGGSREVFKTGTQQTFGAVNPGRPKLTNTKNQWPDSKR
jgi:hypothetical protein